jgi:hypothetical protein
VAVLCAHALDALLGRDFARAVDVYRSAARLAGSDPVLERLLERARHLAASPPPAEWTGVEVFTE